MGSGVAELVRMKRRNPGSSATPFQELGDAGRRQSTLGGEPQLGLTCMGVLVPQAKIGIEGRAGLGPEWHGSGPASLPDDAHPAGIEIEIDQAEAGHLREPCSGVDHEPE